MRQISTQTPIRKLLTEGLLAEEAYLLAETHPQIAAAHRAAIRDYEMRLRELEIEGDLIISA